MLLHHCVTSHIQSASIHSRTINLGLGGVIGVTTSLTPKKDLKKQLMEMRVVRRSSDSLILSIFINVAVVIQVEP